VRHAGKEHNVLVTTAPIAEGIRAVVRAVIVVADFPEVVEVVSGVAVAGAEEFMGNSGGEVARACDAADILKEN